MWNARQFGARLQQARMEAGFTGQQAANYLGMSGPQIYRYEYGSSLPSIAKATMLARLYRCSIDWLAGNESDNDAE